MFDVPELSNNNSKITIKPSSSANAHFLSIVPSQNMRVASGPAAPKQIEEIQAQEVTIPTIKPKEAGYGEHFQYVLQSKKGEKSEPKEKEKV